MILNDEVLATLLSHPSIGGDQQVVAMLQQASKQLQTAVAELLAGHLPVTLHAQRWQQLIGLNKWLRKHAALLQALHVQLPSNSSITNSDWKLTTIKATTAVDELAAVLQAAAGQLQLQSFSLRGCHDGLHGVLVGSSILQHLPAHRLTQLSVEVDLCSVRSIQATAALSNLQDLELSGSYSSAAQNAPKRAYAALAANLQQLTQLRVTPITPVQLIQVQLPPKLQQLHLTVNLRKQPQQLMQLVGWLPLHVHVLRSLQLVQGPEEFTEHDWKPAVAALASAIRAAHAPRALRTLQAASSAEASAVAAADVASVTAQSSPAGQLESFGAGGFCHPFECEFTDSNMVQQLLQSLPASSLVHLECCFDWSNAAQVAALCSFTALRSLQLGADADSSDDAYACMHRDDALAPLSSLQQLTMLRLDAVHKRQLQHLTLPQLQELYINNSFTVLDQQQEPLQLSHLTALRKLRSVDFGTLLAADKLPRSLRALTWQWRPSNGDSVRSVEPILELCSLKKLHIELAGEPIAAQARDLQKLSVLQHLQEVEVQYNWGKQSVDESSAAAAAAAWGVLPVKHLDWSSETVPHVVLQQLRELRGLTSLRLRVGQHLAASAVQLAEVLQQLQSLQQLHVEFVTRRVAVRRMLGTSAARMSSSTGPRRSSASRGRMTSGTGPLQEVRASCLDADDVEGVAAVLRALGSLQELVEVNVELPVDIEKAQVKQLASMLPQLLPSNIRQCCKLGQDEVKLCSSLLRGP
jgi:hypothetical protein